MPRQADCRLGQLGPQLQRTPREQGVPGEEFVYVGLLEVLRPYGVLEMVRTGIVAMRRGTASSSVNPAKGAGAQVAATDEGVSYSV